MRFSLSTLPKQSLPSLQKLITVFGQAEETIVDDTGDQTLRYEFDFLTQEKQQSWQVQSKPITMLFGFDSHSQLKNLYIHYHKYSYWLDVESLSGRLLVIRSE
jgi:Fe-S cluster assembly iron-binding protein IscA